MVFRRSSVKLAQQNASDLVPLSGRDIRNQRPSGDTPLKLEKSVGGRVLDMLANLNSWMLDERDARREFKEATYSARQEFSARVATGLGFVRDIDGNVIEVDEHDRPYVRLSNGEIEYVKVYKVRLLDKDALCSIDNPDGGKDVLLVEPWPSVRGL